MDIRPFVDAGFLDPEAPGAEDTVAMLEYLHGLGVGSDELIDEWRAGNVHAASTGLVLRDGDLTAADMATRVGTSPSEIVETYRLLGVDLPGPDVPRLRADEVDAIHMLLTRAAALEPDEVDEVLRSAAGALTHVAEAVVSVFVGGLEHRAVDADPLGDLERAQVTHLMAETAVEFGTAMGLLFRHHLWAAIERQRASMAGASDRQSRTMTVGFVDLVGFTPLSAEMTATDLVDFIRRFEARSYDIASRAGGRIVKTIGDEVMVAAVDADVGAAIVLDLIDEFGSSGTAPRGGIASGEVVARQGDYFGPVVNLASRLVDEAVPGEVLTDAASAANMTGFGLEPAGRRMLKGFAAPVAVVSVLRPGERSGAQPVT